MIYGFGGYELDCERLELRADGELQAVEPQVFSLLVHLIENREKVVSKDELIEAVWDGRIVSDATLTSRINAARRAVGDTGKDQAVIRTLPRRGFRFVGEIDEGGDRAVDELLPVANSGGGIDQSGLAVDYPSLAVLAFANLSDDRSENYFAEGIAEDITTELSRFGSLFVISRMSSFTYRQSTKNLREIGQELGAEYVLNGSVRRGGDRLRIGVALTDARSGKEVWAERYDRSIEDVFSVQNEIAETVASTLVGRLQKIGTARAQAKKSDNLSAYEYLLRGLDIYKGGDVTPDRAQQAFELFSKAVDEDPGLARAHAWRACAYSRTWGTPASATEIQTSLDMITKALELDSDEAESHRIAGSLYRYMREYAKADYHISKSLKLNPNDAHVIIKAAQHECFMDRSDVALKLSERAMRLNPLFPEWYWEIVAFADYVAGDLAEAKSNMLKVQSPTYAGFALLACAAQEAGDHADAQMTIRRMRGEFPDITLSVFRDGQQHNSFRNAAVLDRFITRLADAGLA